MPTRPRRPGGGGPNRRQMSGCADISLADYAKAARLQPFRGRWCFVCRLPEAIRAQVDQALTDKSVSPQGIQQWLVEVHGYPRTGFDAVTAYKLRNHLDRGHVGRGDAHGHAEA